MNRNDTERPRAAPDGGPAGPGGEIPAPDAPDACQRALARLERARMPAPEGFHRRVMQALPSSRRPSFVEWLREQIPDRRQWAIPALAGAMAALLAAALLSGTRPAASPGLVRVHFQIHAPGARQVELLGDFNRWTPGEIRLQGPDASGHFTAEVELPEGRYEYQFLVDGAVWVTDPNAPAHRPDGFGRDNAVVIVVDERSPS